MLISKLESMDRSDPLAGLRDRFMLPEGKTYLDGNSLGPLPRSVPERIDKLIRQEWGDELIGSWNVHDWIDLPTRTGDRIGTLLGAAPGQVVCADSISVNLFKLISAGLSLRPGRRIVLSQADNFPTDLYIAEGLSDLLGEERCELRVFPEDQLERALDRQVAVLLLTQVNFRTGRLHDIRSLTKRAQDAGAVVLWDLAHSAGVLPIELDEWNVDFAVGCGYKFLNGGPGAPAFLYVAQRHQERVSQPLSGWMGHESPFEFGPGYAPAGNVRRFLSGTPGILGMTALDAALDVFENVSIAELRKKSIALTGAFMQAIDEARLPGIHLITPREPDERGSQVSIKHEYGYAVAQALIEKGIIVDFRAPDIVRFGFSPLYNRFVDAGMAIEALRQVINTRAYTDPRFKQLSTVT